MLWITTIKMGQPVCHWERWHAGGSYKKYREWIKTQPQLLADIEELSGKVLGCWCAPNPCHGQVLLDILNNKI